MKQIHDYVEVMFKELPQTKEVLDIKANILDSMESKYQDYIKSGKSEAEAIGMAIGEFGSMDDIKDALNIVDDHEDYYDPTTVRKFLSFIPGFAVMMACAVFLIIASIAFHPVFQSVGLENVGNGVFLVAILIAVIIFIVNGMKYSQFKINEEHAKKFTPESIGDIDLQIAKTESRFIPGIAVGVGLILGGLVLAYIFDIPQFKNETIQAFSFMMCVAVAVFIIMYVSINHKLPEAIKNLSETYRKQDKRFEEITGHVMALTAIAYVGLGLWRPYLFGVLWIMFPIMAILMALIKSIKAK
ncbi:hypothetical protein G7062_10735 [Erysipelothrix sp. HDW6C]|uniref:permease prefix domain 1-containing protein n=1 Tax=Erysipelothrix sp. HDW6C TaxID=2714930 RepID=UPI001409AE72|nr:permease prefix domain 1-containing protein [Erysipelothrix sp. HDW6C]QIK70741.1 hypothetical protein G7062_10735 [Erysipelothrix sp. HDW6C]